MWNRSAIPKLQAALSDTPVVLIMGARQCGKSTLAEAVCKGTGREYVTLDSATVRAAAAADPDGFIARLGPKVVLDEVQLVPEIFRSIKLAVDRDRKPGRFLLTGSANVMTLPRLSDSLAGRVEIIDLWPLSQGEIEGKREAFLDAVFAPKLPHNGSLPTAPRRAGAPDIMDRVLRGGFPVPAARDDADRRAEWCDSYIRTLLSRDVRDISGIDGLIELPRLMTMLASRNAGLLNYAELSRVLSMPQTTLKRYIALLRTIYLHVELHPWHGNRGSRLTKAPKSYLCDAALAAHLLGADAKMVARDGLLAGALLENFVVMELVKQATWSASRPTLHHFRTYAGREVDVVAEDRKGRVVGIEVKSSHTIRPENFKGMETLRGEAGPKFVRGIILYGGDQTVPFGKDLWAIPHRALWEMTEEWAA